MPCPVCRGICVCGHGADAGAATIGEHVAVLIDPEHSNLSEAQFEATLNAPSEQSLDVTQELEASARAVQVKSRLARELSAVAEQRQTAKVGTKVREERGGELPEWRREVASRVTRHRSRRRPRPERNRSLILNFDSAANATATPPEAKSNELALPELELNAAQALELDVEAYGLERYWPPAAPRAEKPFWKKAFDREETQEATAVEVANELLEEQQAAIDVPDPAPFFVPRQIEEDDLGEIFEPQLDRSTLSILTEVVRNVEGRSESKIIEFPQSVEPVPDELAEPVVVTPRIFEADEIEQAEREQEAVAVAAAAAPQVPSITLHDEPSAEMAPAALELPFPIAPLRQRASAAMIDAAIVGVACAAFGFALAAMSALPEGRTLVVLVGVVPQVFWAMYQYLFLVNVGATPGMLAMRLAVSDFEERPVTRRRMQLRAITMGLSSASLGLGFGWALLDQDRLCWHDRITRTCLVQSQSN